MDSQKVRLYSSNVGVIFDPNFVRLHCVYGGDGGSRGRQPDGCGDPAGFCTEIRDEYDGWCDGHPHHPRDIAKVLKTTDPKRIDYGILNEVVVDSVADPGREGLREDTATAQKRASNWDFKHQRQT